ncbi:MAG TPA: excinuclease ABC subunit UvrC [Methanomicrobiales archaeon]|nr:excinuclease ABC subunit UvrC [Methanomicrobiales archaeon]
MVNLAQVPSSPGCYLFRDAKGDLLYIGKAKDLKKRVSSYFRRASPDSRIRAMAERVAFVDFMVTDNEVEALVLENNLIKRHQPKYNIDLRDAKTYAYIELTKEPFPRIMMARRPSEEGSSFGPFVSARERDRVLRALKRAFGLRTCRRLPKRACLRHHMGSCTAPCVGGITPEEYALRVKRVESILKGGSAELLADLRREMAGRSREQDFEGAMAVRDQIEAVEHLATRQKVERRRDHDEDIINYLETGEKVYLMLFSVERGTLSEKEEFIFAASPEFMEEFLVQYYSDHAPPKELILPNAVSLPVVKFLALRRGNKVIVSVPVKGEKMQLLDLVRRNLEQTFFGEQLRLEALRGALHLPAAPSTIECFDISHLSGTSTVGSMVRFVDGRPEKKGYRRFRIRTVGGVDDTAAITEVVRRRYSRLVREGQKLPDLVIIDGGKGQLAAAGAALAGVKVKIPLISIAKREEEVFAPGFSVPLPLDKKGPASLLIREIRDEAHRFAVAYHRLLRRKKVVEEG